MVCFLEIILNLAHEVGALTIWYIRLVRIFKTIVREPVRGIKMDCASDACLVITQHVVPIL